MTFQNELLEPLSSEHYLALQVCDHIRTGLSKNVEMARIRMYTDWFRETWLEPHFEMEEQYIFPLLGNNVRVKKALANHRRIRKLLSCDCDNERVLNLLEEELSRYIRFEERVLFKEIKANASPEDLAVLEQEHENIISRQEEWKDKFWLS